MSEQTRTGDAPETVAETAPEMEQIPVDAPRVGIIMGSKSDAAAMEAFRLLARTEGIIPAIESSHALAGALELGKELGPDATILVSLSGRGDKDMETAAEYFGLGDPDRTEGLDASEGQGK